MAEEDDDARNEEEYEHQRIESGIVQVTKLFKDGVKIDLIQVKGSSSLFALTRFWSTLQMNYLTAHGFCCAYPALTLKNVGVMAPVILNLNPLRQKFIETLKHKYERRGYTFLNAMTEGDGCDHTSAVCPRARRSFQDGHCYTLVFGTNNEPCQFNAQLEEYSNWRVSWRFGGLHEGLVANASARIFDVVTGSVELKSRYDRHD